MYKVIVFHRHHRQISQITSQIYDSKSDSWSSKRYHNVEPNDGLNYSALSNSVHFNGVLYMYVDKNPNKLLTFDIERAYLRNINEMIVSGYSDYDSQLLSKWCPVDMVVCHSELLAVVFVSRNTFRGAKILVWKVPLILTRPIYAPGPPYVGLVNIDGIEFVNQALSDGQCISFKEKGGNRMLEYNMQENDWREFGLPESVITDFSSLRNCKQEDGRAFPPRDPRDY